jgi:D-3-phosphoglycerate dehydrogenase / 2-oxoglutarate reductase
MYHFYVSDPIHPTALAQLEEMGTVYGNFGANPVPFTEVAKTIDAVLLRAETFTADMISAAPRLTIIARHGTGTDNVDIAAATAAAVWVTVTPGANSGAVAEHVFALLLALGRQSGHASTGTAAGQWSSLKPTLTGFELGGRTLGLVGFGRIARHVGRIARGFGMTVIAADPHLDPESIRQAGAAAVSLPELFSRADVISLHAPLTPQTRHLINSAVLAAMRPGTVLINTSRGELVDEQALVTALQRGHLGGAALDVLEGESVDMREPLAHSYLRDHLGRPDLIVTPHVGGQTDEALLAAGTTAVACIRQALNGDTPDNAVNHIPHRQALAN